jgi:hypothetical protein
MGSHGNLGRFARTGDFGSDESVAPHPDTRKLFLLLSVARAEDANVRGSPIPFKLICGGACSSTVRAADS